MEWTLERLNQFVAVADCGSMTQAARRLGRAQSAVSMAMGLLEADLGLLLFHRAGRAVTLTPAGEVMLLEARALLGQAQALDVRAQALAAGESPKLCVALDEALPYPPLARLLLELSQRYASLDLTLLNGTAAEVADDVQSHRAALAFQFDRGPTGRAGATADGFTAAPFAQRYVASVPQVVCVARHHALAAQPQVTRDDLARHRQLVMHIEGVEDPVVSPRIWRSGSVYVLADMLADGIGWGILPRNIAQTPDIEPRIVALDCPELRLPPLAVRMLSLQGAALSEAALWLPERLAQLLTEGDGSMG
ncbi:LysR family transcriptional regulator [Comamonas serinivorans]|uniref:LysR family transcriptional regulator n=1 Tax=Comamonas serinivorans TaxID=1082851 RepID=A0A1Y0EPG1_9BURK|nr:LysR family transcriptional regulator [Comamonas serinivorans]ARU05330.1 LysR family transcriptional regulator [Comamonas serinivorans]